MTPADRALAAEMDLRRVRASLVHDVWRVFADPTAVWVDYDLGWPMILARFGDRSVRAA